MKTTTKIYFVAALIVIGFMVAVAMLGAEYGNYTNWPNDRALKSFIFIPSVFGVVGCLIIVSIDADDDGEV